MNDKKPHPLDDCDQDACYKVMMTERTALITARQDLENNLVRTVIQISSALVVLMAGFVTQESPDMDFVSRIIFSASLIGLVFAIIAGLGEHWYASKAHLSQQNMVEAYYNKEIFEFNEPLENKYVARCQWLSFCSFVLAIMLLGILSVVQAGVKSDEPTDKLTAAAASASAASAAASATSAATSAASAAASATSAAASASAN